MEFHLTSDFLHFDTSLLLLNVTLRGYLISIAYCHFFHLTSLWIVLTLMNLAVIFRYMLLHAPFTVSLRPMGFVAQD